MFAVNYFAPNYFGAFYWEEAGNFTPTIGGGLVQFLSTIGNSLSTLVGLGP